MKRLHTLLVAMLLFSTATFAQFPDHVKVLTVKLNETKTLSGSLSEGRFVDMRFGMRGSVGCFTEAQKMYFDGHHVFYAFKVPANTKVLAELVTKGNMSLYGYMISSSRYDIPPYLENVSKAGCASSFKEMGELDRVMLKAGDEETHVIIAVTGVEEAKEGAFTLKITAKP